MKQLPILIALVVLVSACAPVSTPTRVPPTPQPQPAAPTSPPPTATSIPPTATTVAPVRTLYPAPTNPIKATLVYTEVSPLGFVQEWSVDAWFDNPNPPMGSNVTLSGSLLHNGLWTGGGQMYAYWMQGGQMQVCSVLVIYQRGICTFPVTGFEPGVYVPITYTFHHDGREYTGYTGFTPR